jgi:3-methyladenine DNA glycosylase/8-oxoguanine DNA glycosylase
LNVYLTVPTDFNFWRTVYSHGWCSLPPFEVVKETTHLKRALELSSGKVVFVTVSQPAKEKLLIEVNNQKKLSSAQRNEIVQVVKSCLRLDEDFSEFYSEAKHHPEFRWVPKIGAGRLLRAPTVFEDVVKMICTTNCSWALTEVMVKNLCKKLGFRFQGSSRNADSPVASFTFPTPEVIADCTEKFLRKEIRAGYRAPYLLELSKRIVKGDLDLELWRQSNLPTEELFKEVRSVKGIGPYAAGNILKLLGRYDYLGIDSWCRKKFFEIHKNGRATSDRVIEKFYEPFGKWRGLFFWLDVTKHWYNHQFPF